MMTGLAEGSSCCRGLLTVATLIAYVLCVALNAVLSIPGVSPFNSTIVNMSQKYSTGITPSGATFGICGLIYLWQLVLVVYSMTLLCRKSNGVPLYVSPAFIPSAFFVSYIINLIGNPAWIVVFLEDHQVKALGLLLLGVVTLVICLVSSCAQLEKSGAEMESKNLVADIWCTRIIIQNGIALYLAWVSCATAINTVVVLCYTLGVSMSTACFGALAVINTIAIGWFILETFVYDRQLRYVFGHYISYIIAFVGIYKAHFNTDVPYTIYSVVLLGLLSVLALTKLIIMIVRGIMDPIHYSKMAGQFKINKLPLDSIKTVAY